MLICGVDEAGRGPLCGAVVAAAVILDPARPIAGINDSKKLTARKREQLALQIREHALGMGNCGSQRRGNRPPQHSPCLDAGDAARG